MQVEDSSIIYYLILAIIGFIVIKNVLFDARVITAIIVVAAIYYTKALQIILVQLIGMFILFKVIFSIF